MLWDLAEDTISPEKGRPQLTEGYFSALRIILHPFLLSSPLLKQNLGFRQLCVWLDIPSLTITLTELWLCKFLSSLTVRVNSYVPT